MSHPNKFFLVLSIIVLFAFGLTACSAANPSAGSTTQTPPVTTISAQVLEEKYGLKINLIAVTAVGGLVDLRIKFVNGEKAKALLEDRTNFPTLLIADKSVRLNLPADTKNQEIQFVDDANLFLMYANAGDTVKPGTPVTVVFGNIQVEPITAK